MSQLEDEIQGLKNEVTDLWELVILQLKKTREALYAADNNLANEVVENEKKVNAAELNLDFRCENFIALLNPVAVDLRLVLATLKINNNLERTGDIADGIARLLLSNAGPFDPALIEAAQIRPMYDHAISMMEELLVSFQEENSATARNIFEKDVVLDTINASATRVLSDFIRRNPGQTESALNILSTIRKLERVGDQCKNMAEEIIFYLEAKVLRHKRNF